MITEFKGEYRFFSNFYHSEIELNGRVFPTAEHAYVSEKSEEPTFKDRLAEPQLSPALAKKLGRDVPLRGDWEHVKIDVMLTVLTRKFKQDFFKNKLLETGTQNIQEGNHHGDRFWGVDLDVNPNVGENHLGRLLMFIRDGLQKGML